jgi:membrane-bound ClpP family serine protease
VKDMDKRDFAFDKVNYILLALGMVVVVIGFLLMSGSGSSETTYNPDIFSARRIKVAPVVCLLGFVSMIYAVVRRPKDGGQLPGTEEEKEGKV